jgi:Fic family protein
MHRLLLSGTRLMNHGGTLRDSQNWIGGSDYNPCNAAFVPPPADEVRPLLEDLCAFCNSDDLPAVAQAAIAHAQFETIHPFTDGNGRTGRALIHVIFRRRRLAPRVLPPVSLVLATWSRDYIDSLMATRYVGSPDAPEAIAGLNRWIGLFAAACRRAVDDARIYEETVAGLKARWLERLGRPRRRSAAALLLDILPAYPILSVGSAARVMGRSFQATNQAIGRLLEAHILRPIKVGRRNRAFEAAELIDAFNVLERRLASPTGDTRISPPARRAPARRR